MIEVIFSFFFKRKRFLKKLGCISVRLGPMAGSEEPLRKKPGERASYGAKEISTSLLGPGLYSQGKIKENLP